MFVYTFVTWNRVDRQLPGMKDSQVKKVWTPAKQAKDVLYTTSIIQAQLEFIRDNTKADVQENRII